MLCDASVLDDSDLIRGLLLLVVYSEPGGMYIYIPTTTRLQVELELNLLRIYLYSGTSFYTIISYHSYHMHFHANDPC